MKWLAAFAAAMAVALVPSGVYADVNSRGGVITGYVANGASGTVTVTVTNPYGSGASVSVGVNVFGGPANGQSQGVSSTLPAGGSATFTFKFGQFSSTATGAGVSNGSDTAQGTGSSTGGKCDTCDGGGPEPTL